MSDIAFSPEMLSTNADEVELRPITARGRDYFQLRFSPGVVSVRLKRHAAIAMIETAGLNHSVDKAPRKPADLPTMLRKQAD